MDAGDAAAAAPLERYHDRLGRGLASLLNLLDPEVVVLGGGMSNIPRLADAARAVMARFAFCDVVASRVVTHVHGDSSGVRGAAWLWPA